MNNEMKILPKEDFDNLMSSFWTMLKELEGKAKNDDDLLLMNWVVCWHGQYNSLITTHD